MSDGHTHSTIGGNIDAMTLGVDGMMMLRAQQDGVVQRCNSALSPVNDVVSLGPPWRPIAAGEDTPAIAYHECPTHVWREGSHRAAYIEGKHVGVDNKPMNFAITCQSLRGLARD